MPKPSMTRFCNLSVEPNTTNVENGMFAPKLTQAEINQIPETVPDIDGAVLYNKTTRRFNFGIEGHFNSAGTGNVSGPDESTLGHIPIFGNTGGTLLEDGGVLLADIVEGDANPNTVIANQVAVFTDVNGRHITNSVGVFNPAGPNPEIIGALELAGFEPTNNTTLANIGWIQFNNAGTGAILVDSLVAMKLVLNEFVVGDSQVCLIMGPGIGTETSSSVSALIELQTTTGAILLSRMTTAQRDALVQIRDGMVIYNTTTNKFNFHENGTWNEHAEGTVTSITAGTGLNGGTITTSGTIDLANTAVTAGDYTSANITIDAQGRITAAANGNDGTVKSITAAAGLTGGTITTTGTIGLANTGVTAGTYTYSTVQVNSFGQITAAFNGTPPVTAINNGAGIIVTGTTTPTVSLTTTGVTAGSYTNANITVDDRGRITVASNGSAGSGTVTSITAGTGLNGGTITTSGTIDLANTTVTAGSYTLANITVDAQGRITTAANGTAGDVTGAASSVSGNVVTFSGTTGKIIQDSGVSSANLYYAGHPTTLIDTFGSSYNFFAGTGIGTGATTTSCTAIGNQILINATATSSIGIGQGILTNAPGSDNIAIGIGTQISTTNISASNNISIGNASLGLNATGGNNTVVGTSAAQYLSGSDNVILGYLAMNGIDTTIPDTATRCIAIGSRSLLAVGTCLGSIAIGYESQMATTNSTFNISIGHRSAQNLTNSSNNICIGNNAGSSTTTGSGNTIVGDSSFAMNITGNYCVTVGAQAGKGSVLDYNTFIGYQADTTGSFTNATAIGAHASVSISNAIVLGNGCNVGIGINNPSYALHLGNGLGLAPLIYVAASGTIAPPAVANDGVYMVIAGRPYFTSGNGNTGYLVTTLTTGSNATAGLTTLNGTTGTVVLTASVLADSRVHVTRHNGTGVPSFTNQGHISVGSIVPGVSFTIYSNNALDTEGVSWTMQP